jgi:TrmH family RNA methyltransferase
MLTKNQIKEIKQLHLKKYRLLHGLFIVEGNKLVSELLESAFKFRAIYCVASEIQEYPETQVVSNDQMQQISTLSTPPGVLAIVEFPVKKEALFGKGWTIILNDINDPGNLGTILRTADWFGIRQIICSENCVDVYNPKVVQASMGAIYRVNVLYKDVLKVIEEYRAAGISVFAADMHGKDVNTLSFPENGVLLMGSESHGISAEIRSLDIQFVTIPGKGKTESLNVSIAAAIICSRLPIK